jgi:hypothetical protein
MVSLVNPGTGALLGASLVAEKYRGYREMNFQNIFTVAAATFLVFQNGVPANATMLQGGVQANASIPSQHLIAATTVNQAALRDARARALEGVWQSSTQVTGSTVPSIMPGTVVQSMVQYSRDAKGDLVESWCEEGWTPSSASVVKLDNAVMTTSHVSTQGGRGGSWSARTHDVFRMVSPNTMVGESIVDQYINGQLAGQYKTSSILRKAS